MIQNEAILDEARMKIYHVEPECYGSSGTIVLAATEARAKELYLEANPDIGKYPLCCAELTDRSDVEFCCPDFGW